jgi:hypothetical protein
MEDWQIALIMALCAVVATLYLALVERVRG